MDIWRRQNGSDHTDDPATGSRAEERLAVGLALGGGAARGFAHIGVLRTLIAHGIRPDVIAGTSIGAVVGGFYAAGQLDVFEDWSLHLTRRRMLGYLDFKLGGSGLIGGIRLADRLDDTIGDAMSASYALPGIFPPKRIGGRWLMDGALVNPLPISAARALGARLVIAVNLNADNFGRGTIIQDHGPDAEDDALRSQRMLARSRRGLFKAERLIHRQFFGADRRPGLSTVMIEAFQVMQDRITRTRLAGDPPDVMISPRLGRINLFDFHRAKDTIAAGAEAAEKSIDAIRESIAALT